MIQVQANIILAQEDDFDWIYQLHGKNTKLLGAPYPAAIRQDLYKGHILTTDDKLGFCQFTPPKRNFYTTVHIICTKDEARGKHIASQFVEYLCKTYEMPVRAVCETDTLSEKFWSSQGAKIGEKQSKKGTPLSIYEVGENVKSKNKISL